ncbi:ankyrin repeat domain-containing protein [Azospirillum thermophilum]|uniref:ORC1/DEAH AAA+ ATPase domain-containing protein n=1 Tax=Azospirillum thermophilum TaxID=2202148 RepID=A0A2S2CQ56_9PROT|nr:ankyrin repeat domain-containing protein [Azospirillum thermophilum]AWK86565.1 hypothetical protein DEW08_10225 [Azospirillum thermophilum]
MDRSASQAPRPQTSCPPAAAAGPAGADAQRAEVYEGLLLALLARKRLLVLVGEVGSGRRAIFRDLVEHVASDGAMVLPVTARLGAEVDDLMREAGEAALPAEEDEERDFDALIEALEERLELAGTGLLAVENAGLLAPPVLGDLIDLSRSETPSGRFLQILLCGTPELERTLARPGLAEAVRDLGVIYRLSPGASPTVTPRAPEEDAEPAPSSPRPRRFIEPAPSAPAPPEMMPRSETTPAARPEPVDDWDRSFDWTARDPSFPPPSRPHRRTALVAGAALTTLVLLAGAGVAVWTAMPGSAQPGSAHSGAAHSGAAQALGGIERSWDRATGAVERAVRSLLGDRQEDEALALASRMTEPRADPAAGASAGSRVIVPAQPSIVTTKDAAAKDTGSAPAPRADAAPSAAPGPEAAAKPPAGTPPAAAPSGTQVAAVPPSDTTVRTDAGPGGPVPSKSPNAEAAPAGAAALPPLEEPAAGPAAGSALTSTGSGDGDQGQQQRVRSLADQAKRQIAGKRLTTPPGDNAFETLQRLRQIAPTAPEAADIQGAIEQTYRRWAAAAERDGDFGEARRFYERALSVSPDSADLQERLKSAGDKRLASDMAATATTSTTPEVEPGLDSREAVLALLRRPAELSRMLQSGTAPDTRVGNGKTLLMIAAEQGLTDAVKLLLDRKARTDLRTADGATAVMYAAWGGHESTVTALADGGADLDATNDDGKTALMAAAARGHLGVVQALIQRSVQVDRSTANGWTALMYAANNGHDRVARLLVDHGANPYRMDTNGNSALTLGALQGHVQVVEALKPR